MISLAKKIVFLCCLSLNLIAQTDSSLDWIKELAREVQEETDLCERCTWIPPAISEVVFNGELFYFLRYGCSTTQSVARMYRPDGLFLGECQSNDDAFACNPPNVDAFLTFTFSSRVTVLWSCETGFECAYALANEVEREVPIFVDDTRCAEGVKTLRVSDKFSTFEWEGEGAISRTPTLQITQGGDYTVTVTDDMGCTSEGNITIPAIDKLTVKIKGTPTICPEASTDLLVFGYESYEWSTGATESGVEVRSPDTYQVTVTNDQNCQGTAQFTLQNFDLPTVTITGNPYTIVEGNSVNVSVNIPPEAQPVQEIAWTTNGEIDCSDCQEANYIPLVDNALSVQVVDKNGCANTTDFTVEVIALGNSIYAPTIFSPNSTNGNIRFTLFGGTNVRVIESLTIYNRWGNLIFSKNNFPPNRPENGWDGQIGNTSASEDIYLFQSVVLFANGERKMIAGDVFLVR
ncbi:MAG: gliding motility-associated C-terminal domain-containing protein [Bacteroidota bacterium]